VTCQLDTIFGSLLPSLLLKLFENNALAKYEKVASRVLLIVTMPSTAVTPIHPTGGGLPTMRLKNLLPSTESQEPVGIVIADGGRGDLPTRFSAFVWGPVPDDEPAFAGESRGLVAALA
jgi:hypothetical protein